MQYDPVKRRLGVVFNSTPFLRKVFYNLLDLLLLRSWHIHRELKAWAKDKRDRALSIYDAGAGFGQYTLLAQRPRPQVVRDRGGREGRTGRGLQCVLPAHRSAPGPLRGGRRDQVPARRTPSNWLSVWT